MKFAQGLLLCLVWSVMFLGVPRETQALIINLTSTGNIDADAGFRRAADFIESQFIDDVTINIDAGFASLDPGVLGSAGSSRGTISFAGYKAAVAADVTSVDDQIFSDNLPSGVSFSLYTNRTSDNPNGSGSATPYVDNDGGANNTTVRMTFANAKALGLLAADNPDTDATITFSSNFAFDFDPSDGISSGAIDFVGVAVHELFHAMGFISGVDILDGNSPPGNGPFNDDQFTFVAPLDFTRHSDDSITAGASIDWTADDRDKFYSIDGGETALIEDAWSTGVNFGDGEQASHWRDNQAIGILDPTSVPAGFENMVTAADLHAIDILGWDSAAIPEPATMLVLLTGMTMLSARRRRD